MKIHNREGGGSSEYVDGLPTSDFRGAAPPYVTDFYLPTEKRLGQAFVSDDRKYTVIRTVSAIYFRWECCCCLRRGCSPKARHFVRGAACMLKRVTESTYIRAAQ